MGQMAGDLGWREFETRAGGGGVLSVAETEQGMGGLDCYGWGQLLGQD